jgi:TonB family protein
MNRLLVPTLLTLILLPATGLQAQGACCTKVPDGEDGIQVDEAPVPVNGDQIRAAMQQVADDGMDRQWEGRRAFIWVRVGDTGGVQDTRISRSSGDSALDRALLAAVAVARFRPAVLDDEAVAVWIEIPVRVGPPSSI